MLRQIIRNTKTYAMSFQTEKERYLSMSLEEKRQHYSCGNNFKRLSDIPTLAQTTGVEDLSGQDIRHKVSLYLGDITTLEIDVIVNAANERLVEGGGVDQSIHSAAGRELLAQELQNFNGCAVGNSVLTGGYKLPAKYIIHTVGPIGENPEMLKRCYWSSLELMAESNLHSIAFPCISTGVYNYPNEAAAQVAITTMKDWLTRSPFAKYTQRIIFCCYEKRDYDIYNELLPQYFQTNRL